jgi:hypothetical protein
LVTSDRLAKAGLALAEEAEKSINPAQAQRVDG